MKANKKNRKEHESRNKEKYVAFIEHLWYAGIFPHMRVGSAVTMWKSKSLPFTFLCSTKTLKGLELRISYKKCPKAGVFWEKYYYYIR